MKAEIITIGTEITIGSTLNTNAYYLAQKLFELGIENHYQTTVDDDAQRLKDVISIALNRADIIITTGGLGPTKDDMTKEVIAEVMGLELEHDPEMEKHIQDMFTRIGRCMSSNNRKQATKPEGSIFIENSVGTAPGIYIYHKEKKIIMLPGPPREMRTMFENHVKDLIQDDYIMLTKSVNTVGIGESSLESRLNELNLAYENINIATFARDGRVEIKLIGKGLSRQEIERDMDEIIARLNVEFREYIYGYDNISLEEVVVNQLIQKGLKIGLCESCTGGLVSSMITRVPGASNVLDRAVVTYSNEAKMEELNVKSSTLKKYGAVSEETAYEMAKGLMEKVNLDLVASITGIAGPTGANENKPVGLVYVCIMSKDRHKVIKLNFNGNRIQIQNRTAINVLDEIRKYCRDFN